MFTKQKPSRLSVLQEYVNRTKTSFTVFHRFHFAITIYLEYHNAPVFTKQKPSNLPFLLNLFRINVHKKKQNHHNYLSSENV